jgi:hypothetical protein
LMSNCRMHRGPSVSSRPRRIHRCQAGHPESFEEAQGGDYDIDVVIVCVFEQLCRSNASRRSYAAASLGVGYQSHSDILVRVTGGNARCNARGHPSHDPIGGKDDERRPGA